MLQVRVNDELVIAAGTCEATLEPSGPEWIIRPPATTLFHQVLAYLREKPDPPTQPSGSMVGREGVAAAALVLRWGSYLAVLADHDKAVWAEVDSPATSRMSDEEMARINFEASAALADWIEPYCASRGGRGNERLVDRAVAHLPMPNKTSRMRITEVAALRSRGWRRSSSMRFAHRSPRASNACARTLNGVLSAGCSPTRS